MTSSHVFTLATRAPDVQILVRPLGCTCRPVPGGFELGFPTREAQEDAHYVIHRNLALVARKLGVPVTLQECPAPKRT